MWARWSLEAVAPEPEVVDDDGDADADADAVDAVDASEKTSWNQPAGR